MRALLCTIKVFAFWGIVFLLILVLGFHVRIIDIFELALHGDDYLNFVCIYFLVSIPLYVVLVFGLHFMSHLTLIEDIAIGLSADLWTPHKAVSGILMRQYAGDCFVFLRHLIEMVLWWGIVYFSIYMIFHIENNQILHVLKRFSRSQTIHILLIVLGVYCIVSLLAKLFQKIVI